MNKALLVALNQYAKQTPLYGCINDVDDVKQALVARGAVKDADVVILTDAKATKQAILDGLTSLVSQLQAGDTGYFHFSGHGVRMQTTDPDEPDALDEVLCPYEFDWSATTAVTDNEVLAVLATLKLDCRMIVTIDSCHSGDQARRLTAKPGEPRTLTPPAGFRTRGPTRNGFRTASRAPNISFVSACSPWQVAADTSFDGRANGAFTYHFLKQVSDSSVDTTLTDIVLAIEPALRLFEMTPVAENGDVPYFPATRTGKRGLGRLPTLTRAVSSARAGAVVFERLFHTSLLGQDFSAAVRISASNGELMSYVSTTFMGQQLTTPPIRTTGNMTFPISLGYFGIRLLFAVSDWQYASQAITFTLDLSLSSDLPFVPRVHVARIPVHVNVAGIDRNLGTTATTSPADLLALLTLQQMNRPDATTQSRDPGAVRGFRDPWIQVFDSGVAGWGPNHREDRVIRPFTNRPRPDGIRRHSVDIGPQRGSGNVYVVGWLSDQETDFDFILHMGNHFFGGWGDIDWRVQGYYADIQPFPRASQQPVQQVAAAQPAERRPREPVHHANGNPTLPTSNGA